MAQRLAYYNVNENGEPYGRQPSEAAAVQRLMSYPNDTVVICVEGGPTDEKLAAELRPAAAVLAEVQAEMNRTVEQMSRPTARDYASDVIRRLALVYEIDI